MKNYQEEFYPAALTIAGSDSGGGAGIQADLRTFNAAGIYGCSVITAVTAQNPRKVAGFSAVEPELVKKQLESVFEAIAVKAVKTGMLANAKIVETVAEFLKNHKLPLIVDPVMISTSGSALLDKEGCEAMKKVLLPMASLITPNIPEAEYLVNAKLKTEKDYADAAMQLANQYKCNILLKTGHGAASGKISDVAVLERKVYLLTSPRVSDLEEYSTHGTGCTLSSGITAMLAAGNSWKDALIAAKAHVLGALNEMAHIGKSLDAMYPPLEDYSRQVTLRIMQKTEGNNAR